MRSLTTETPYFDSSIPRVCIVGRPNVGKSTLFNRLLKKRKAITDPTPGVTRDPVRALWNTGRHDVVLIDTGGLTESKDYLDTLITAKSMKTASEAEVLILLLDVEAGLTPDDEDFIRKLRTLGGRIIVAVNKADNEKRLQEVWNFHSIGFATVIGLSATHGSGIESLVEAIDSELDATAALRAAESDSGTEVQDAGEREVEEADPELGQDREGDEEGDDENAAEEEEGGEETAAEPEKPWQLSLAILGQPNTGKSTLVNLLCNSDLSIVSPIAGTTRDVIEGSFVYKGSTIRILDTAGIRRKARVHEDLEYYSVTRAIASIDEADVVLLMIDAEKGLTDQDKKIASHIVDKGRGVILVLNKWDLMQNLPNQLNAVTDRMRFLFPILSFAPIRAISAKEGRGVDDLLSLCLALNARMKTRTDTGKLNSLLAKWVDYTPPPSTKGGGRWKLRYMTQVSVNPIEFLLFVNRAEGFPPSYLSYIQNCLRKDCGLDDVPFRVRLRTSGTVQRYRSGS